MAKTKCDLIKEKLEQPVSEVIDELSRAIKKSSMKFFDACFEILKDICSESFDDVTEKAKEKVKKGAKEK
jgi:hypothetical protein